MADKQVQPGQLWKIGINSGIPVGVKFYYIFVTKLILETDKFLYYQLDDPKQILRLGNTNLIVNSKECDLVSG